MAEDLDVLGPVDYLLIEFPGGHLTGEGLPLLVDLVDRGIIRILDLLFIRKALDGSVGTVSIAELDETVSAGLIVFDGASSGLLGREDINEAASALKRGSTAGLLLYENRWAVPLATAIRRGGGHLVASGRIPVHALLAALDASEPAAVPAGRG